MLLDWMMIFAAIIFCIRYFNPLTYFLAVLLIGARMHALAILMHDATHFRFLKNRKWNDIVTNVLVMYPIFSSIEQYRKNHLAHHQHLNTEDDPDWAAKLGKRAFTFPKTKAEFIWTVLSYLTLVQGFLDALWFLKRFGANSEEAPGKKEGTPKLRLAFYLLLFTLISVQGWWGYYLAFWVVPYLSTFFMYQYIRSVAEHFGELAYDHLLSSTRSVKANWLEKLLLAPHNVGYHLEHHLYPAVPYYHLPALHRLLMEEEEYGSKAHITQGYCKGLLQELGNKNVNDNFHNKVNSRQFQ
jgi:fatty acid desaturase